MPEGVYITKAFEKWLPVPGYEGYYEVSNEGRIRSCNRTVLRKDGSNQFIAGIIKQYSYFKNGYVGITLCKKGKVEFARVHRLVALAFLPNPDNRPFINHIDCDIKNNHLSNLEWCTQKENMQHAVKLGRLNSHMAGKYNELNHMSKAVNQLNIDGSLVRVWPSMREAERAGFDQPAITLCCKGKLKTHANFKWQYNKSV